MSSHDSRVTFCSHQDGKQRYPATEIHNRPPKIASWRNNLTALSQYRNLYFVVHLDTIAVFEPDFPNQGTRDPAGTIQLPATRPGLEGYLDEFYPQAANQILVKDLGEEEILLVVCDGGDTIGYTVRSIHQALNRQDTTLFVSPFFHENVGASAWGVDVHQSARLIAVSSNTHDILLFAFALSGEGEEPVLSEIEHVDYGTHQLSRWRQAMPFVGAPLSSLWKRLDGVDCMKKRHKNNYAWILSGHDTNIPNISFLSTDDDEAVYLASIDIDGTTKIWDIWKAEEIVAISIQSRGWAVGCLDHKLARIVATDIDTYGCAPNFSFGRHVVNNSDCASLVMENSQWHPGFSSFSTAPMPPAIHQNNAIEDPQDLDQEDVLPADESDEIRSNANSESELSDKSTSIDLDIHVDTGGEGSETTQENISSEPQIGPSSLLCTLFSTSEKDILLIERLYPRSEDTPRSNLVICKDALSQNIPPGLTALKRIERLNMIQQIPELGIVVVGNQAGRVGLLTLTFQLGEQRYGFKIETVLPQLSQEKQGMRPNVPLLGMAVSPIQGCGGEAYSPSRMEMKWDWKTRSGNIAEGRYRLLLMYYDHTILAYEISRRSDGMLLF